MARSESKLTDKRSRQGRERRQQFAEAVSKTRKPTIGRSTTADTPLHIRARDGQLDDDTREHVRQRVGFKLGKFALHVTRVSVRFEDVAGPKGKPVQLCKVKAVLPNTEEVVVSSTGATPRAAFDVAIDVAERAVRRLLDRIRPSR